MEPHKLRKPARRCVNDGITKTERKTLMPRQIIETNIVSHICMWNMQQYWNMCAVIEKTVKKCGKFIARPIISSFGSFLQQIIILKNKLTHTHTMSMLLRLKMCESSVRAQTSKQLAEQNGDVANSLHRTWPKMTTTSSRNSIQWNGYAFSMRAAIAFSSIE